MIFVIGFFLLSTYISWCIIAPRNSGGDNLFLAASLSIFITLGASLACAVLVHLVQGPNYQTEYTKDIVSVSDTTLTQGHFSIFGGQIGDTPYYFYFYKDKNGAIRQGHIETSKTTIYEDSESSLDAKLIFKTDHINWAVWPKFGYSSYYVFHVPKGSVDTSIKFRLPGN